VNRSIGVRVVEKPSGEVAIEITDSGPGTIPELKADYFDLPLLRTEHPLRSNADKPDLGLVASILRSCGGRLEVRGSKTDGTTLVLLLPRAATSALATPTRISA
jgi:sensor histidine kinase regulating citrate/malate metabolism